MRNNDVVYYVIGSGMGGASIIIKLIESGFKVVLIDIDDSKHKNTFKSVGEDFRHESTISCELGGGSNLWHGVTAPYDREDFSQSVGISKFISYDEMLKYWRMASEFIGFNRTEMELQDIQSEALLSKVSDFPFDKSVFKAKLYKVLRRPTRLKEKLLLLEDSKSLTIIRNAVVKCINIDSTKHSVESVTYVNKSSGTCCTIPVDNLIMCAGAINTSCILLNSKFFNEGDVCNPRGLIGRGYFDHPMGFLGKILFKKPFFARMYSDLTVSINDKLRLGLVPIDVKKYGNTNIYFRPSTSKSNSRNSDRILLSLVKFKNIKDLTLKAIIMLLSNPNVLVRAILNKYSLPIRYRAADIFFVSEQSYNAASRIYLNKDKDQFGFSEAIIDWKISDDDYLKINNLFVFLKQYYSKSKDYELIDYPDLKEWKKIHTSAAHHLGGIIVGDSIENSTVDENLKFHGLKNLWICDGSILPAVGNSNPSLSIIAFAIRLAEHFKSLKK